MTLTLTSQAFRQSGEIPAQHTCEGRQCIPAARVVRCARERRKPGADRRRP